MMNNNNVVKLNDAEMEKVFGGCGQTTEYVTENTTTVKEVAPKNNNIFVCCFCFVYVFIIFR